MGTACFLLPKFKNYISPFFRDLHQFSSSAALIRRAWTLLPEEPESDEPDGGSFVYRRALKYQRPITVQYDESLRNSVSFIGTIDYPIKNCNTTNGHFGVYTMLNVKASPGLYRDLRVLLKMWHEMAEISVQHLKPNDLIYVSGHLGWYTKVDEYGRCIRCHEVQVKEINFVAQSGLAPACKKSKKLESGDSTVDYAQKKRDRLHLWQVFFTNPNEWWDNRKSKPRPNHPDFKHKDTGEVLWLQDNDPPWIKKQVQLYDARLREQSPENILVPFGL
ncbi:protein OSB1, mitochondrial-like [Olea europaea var. sylvestris]|uniref:protein OSB1, mitochondrial-like n=1 Tax=Olea europaea var. sylvestris TaxID=158386 RepID=UPI000C1D1AFC|nr:protein OSB1, mitochondrial-like [Olea europaea var. sylvestris]